MLFAGKDYLEFAPQDFGVVEADRERFFQIDILASPDGSHLCVVTFDPDNWDGNRICTLPLETDDVFCRAARGRCCTPPASVSLLSPRRAASSVGDAAPVGKVRAGVQRVRMLGAGDPLPHRQQRREQVPGRHRIPRRCGRGHS